MTDERRIPVAHTCGTRPDDVKAVADLIASSRAEGYALAVERLRDDDRYTSWWTARDYQDPDGVAYWKPWPRRQLADYLESVASDAGEMVQRPVAVEVTGALADREAPDVR